MTLEQLNKFFISFIVNVELFCRLFIDVRVPLITRFLFVFCMVAYVLFPIDVLPDFLPAIGQVDDLLVVAMLMTYFIKACPPDVLDEHKLSMQQGHWKISFLKHLISRH